MSPLSALLIYSSFSRICVSVFKHTRHFITFPTHSTRSSSSMQQIASESSMQSMGVIQYLHVTLHVIVFTLIHPRGIIRTKKTQRMSPDPFPRRGWGLGTRLFRARARDTTVFLLRKCDFNLLPWDGPTLGQRACIHVPSSACTSEK